MKSRRISKDAAVTCCLIALGGFLVQCSHEADTTSFESEPEGLTAALPSPWVNKDIGTTGATGTASAASDVFTIKGAGADIWGTADAFQFVYEPITGDAQLVAQVQSVQNTNSWAKAGVMIRETLNANSKYMMVALTPGNGVTSQKRTSTGGSSSSTSGGSATAPYYIRIKRSGSTITTSKSSNGSTWTTVETATISMASAAYIGMSVTSHKQSTLCTATMRLISGPTITTQPQSQTVVAATGKTVTFTIAATGTAPLTYQWYWVISGTPYAVGTGTSLAISAEPSASLPLTASYYCVVTDGAGNTKQSNTATLTVNPPGLTITTQPQSQTVTAAPGKTVTFTVAATGTAPPLSYQWYWVISGTPYAVGTGTSLAISAEPSASLPLTASYYCVVTDSAGDTKQSNTATLTVNPPGPTITTQPQSQIVMAAPGKTVTFTIAATGTAPLSYQWYWVISGTPYAVGTGTSLAISAEPSASLPLTASYYCVVTDGAGYTRQSNTATLTVNPPGLTITTQPQSQTVCAGPNATFTIAATGTGPLTYQWYWVISGTPYAVGTGPSLAISAAPSPSLPLTASYYCVVTDVYGYTAQSNTVTLTVNPLPSAPILYQWGETTDHVWVQLDSPDGLGINYRYSDDAGSSWVGWRNDGYSHFWPNVGPLGLPSGWVVVQSYVVNGYGCSSSIAQGSYIH